MEELPIYTNDLVDLDAKPDGVMWKETDYHKQKDLEKRNLIFRRGGRK